jgi:hypothetical protein
VGFKDLFGGGGKSKVDKLVKTATNPYAQSADRYAAMEQLLGNGSDDALVGLMKRFTIVSTKSIEDEEEKGWVYRRVCDLGAKALPAVKRFCLESDNVAWALRIVEDVANAQQEWDILDAMLERHPPEYARDPKTKIQLLTHLGDIEDQRVPTIFVRYLEDPDEGVRFFAVEQLVDFGDEESSKARLVEHLVGGQEDSLRVRTKILDGLSTLGWDVSAWQDKLVKNLGTEHAYKSGKIARR